MANGGCCRFIARHNEMHYPLSGLWLLLCDCILLMTIGMLFPASSELTPSSVGTCNIGI